MLCSSVFHLRPICINCMFFSSQLFKLINVADDTTPSTKLYNEDDMNESINDELTKIHDWFKAKKTFLKHE